MRILTARSWLTFRTTSRVSLYAPMLRLRDRKICINSIRCSSLIWQGWIGWTQKTWGIETSRRSLTPISRWAQILSIRWSRRSSSRLSNKMACKINRSGPATLKICINHMEIALKILKDSCFSIKIVRVRKDKQKFISRIKTQAKHLTEVIQRLMKPAFLKTSKTKHLKTPKATMPSSDLA